MSAQDIAYGKVIRSYAHDFAPFDGQHDECVKCGIVGPADTDPGFGCNIQG